MNENEERKIKELTSLVNWAYDVVIGQLKIVNKWERDNHEKLNRNDSALHIQCGEFWAKSVSFEEKQLIVTVEFSGWEGNLIADYPVDDTWAEKTIQNHLANYEIYKANEEDERAIREKINAEKESRLYEELKKKFELKERAK